MRKAQEKPVEELIDFSYEGKPLPPNLLDYRHMQISMSRWADTGRIGCLGTLTMSLALFSMCAVGIAAYWLLVTAR